MGIIGVIIVIWIVWAIIASIIERYRQGIRDKVAHEVLDNIFDFEKEKMEILAVNQNLSYVKTENASPRNSYFVLRNRCPSCGGILVARRGTYGAFLGCSNYPRCHFTRQIN